MNRRRILATLAACTLAGTIMFGASAAYLTDAKEKNNHFTIGNVKIDLTEPSYPGDEAPEVKNETPNQETPKDPQVKNTGKNDAVIFLSVTVPLKDFTPIADDGTKGQKVTGGEIYYMKLKGDSVSDHKNHFGEKWVELTDREKSDGKTKTYVFGYSERVAPEASTTALFEKVQLKNILEYTEAESAAIDIRASAIQADNILSGSSAVNTSGRISDKDLMTIYDIYVRQDS